HPLESFWLAWGPVEQNSGEWDEREAAFADITRWLLFAPIDFDFISEALLPTQSPKQSGKQFIAGKMRYDAVIVPGLRTMRATTLRRLEQFARAGGAVIFAGSVPQLVDAAPSAAPAKLAKRCRATPWNRRTILDALRPFKEIDIRNEDGSPADSILYQLRADGKNRNLFLCNTDRVKPRRNASIVVSGKWDVTQLDTMSGQSQPLHARVEGARTIIPWSFDPHGHVLLSLRPAGKHS